MATDINTLKQDEAVSTPGKPKVLPLERVLDQVRRDSRQDTEEYLDETVVPHGGE